MPRLTLRTKLLTFAVIIAMLPLLVAGQSMIRIAADELKSAANEQLITVAQQVAQEIDSLYGQAWFTPMLLLRNAIDNESLGIREKIALLTAAVADSPDFVALQLTIESIDLPVVVTKDDFNQHLQGAVLDPLRVLKVPKALIEYFRVQGSGFGRDVTYLPESDDWLATVMMPMQSQLMGNDATLSARIDLSSLRRSIAENRFNKTGSITIVDAMGRQIFDPEHTNLSERAIVREAIDLLESGMRAVRVSPYTRPEGQAVLGAFAIPQSVPWVVLAEMEERDAYLAIDDMSNNLAIWLMIGLGVAICGALLMAIRMSGPILEIARVAIQVAQGNFQARVVKGTRSKDEIGELARRINEMTQGLHERFQLQKFVSLGTIDAIRSSKGVDINLGGTRVQASMLFCDIRGYTAFAERHPPKVVVDVLNFYFQQLADIVSANGGDIDKFIGDAMLAVFLGDDMERNAVRCALAMHRAMAEQRRYRSEQDLTIGIGINTGEVTIGAMGSHQRMDYTVLGDAVNVAARLCSRSNGGQTLIGATTYNVLADLEEFSIEALEPISLKGKTQPVPVFDVRSVDDGERVGRAKSTLALDPNHL
jgi:adenylate cyclase